MSSFFPGVSGSGQNANLNNSYEPLGWNLVSGNPDGTLTLVTASTSANAYGATSALGTTANAWAGFLLYLGPANSTNRYVLDISFDGGTTWAVTGLYCEPSSSGMQPPLRLPLAVPQGATISVHAKCSASPSQTIRVGVVGIIRNSSSPPCFSTMTGLNFDGAATRAATADTALSGTGSPTYTQAVASTAAAYGALFVMLGAGATAPVTAQAAALSIATGASGSEVEIARQYLWIAASALTVPHFAPYVIEKSIPVSTRISAKVAAAVPGSDAIRVGIYGLA